MSASSGAGFSGDIEPEEGSRCSVRETRGDFRTHAVRGANWKKCSRVGGREVPPSGSSKSWSRCSG